jgi:hypothetical protein
MQAGREHDVSGQSRGNMRHAIGQRVEVDLFGLRRTGDLSFKGVAVGTIVDLTPGAITVRLDDRDAEVTVGPSRVLSRVS